MMSGVRGVQSGVLFLFVVSFAAAVPAQVREPVASLGPVEVLGSGPSRAEFGVGSFDVLRQGESGRAAAMLAQLRYGRKLYGIGPAIGLMTNLDGGVFAYGGLYADFAWGKVIITPVLGLGGYHEGGSKDLGGVFQFRTEIGFAYELQNGSRLGVRITHISNAGIHSRNPGEEEVLLTYSLPFSF